MPAAGGGQRARPLRFATLVALVVALLAAAAAAWGVHSAVTDQEHRLLKERANELNLLLGSSIGTLDSGLTAQGAILNATNRSRTAYEKAAADAVAQVEKTSQNPVGFAWLRPQAGGGWVVVGAAGTLHRGEVIDDARAPSLQRATTTPLLVPTPIVGADRKLGFALGPPAAPAGTVLYRESELGPLKAPQAASTAPFAELDLVIYNSTKPNPAMALATTTTDLPLKGYVVDVPLKVGADTWDVSTKARKPLSGGFAHEAWWIVLLIALLAAFLIALVIETAARRRDDALALYASEHEVAETLQRSLLPHLPVIDGLELAARYLAGGRGQEVGGDWYDAFPLDDGRVGIAVGDVIGHDLAAASAMAQIRAVLRAYAVDGEAPAQVVNQLDHLIDTLGLTQLVTVIYGVLDPPGPDGSRLLTYANAGHLPPLVRRPGGHVEQLTGGESVVIGAPIPVQHAQVEQRLEVGSTLVLFTDGLVEVPGRPIDDTVRELSAAVGEGGDGQSLDAICDRVLATTHGRDLRDDIALLAIRVTAVEAAHVAEPVPSQSSHEPV
jgi:hypothetical protein